jgi:gentisate 1,2-dioxygenase
LILTPQTCWHDHGSLPEKPVIWLDVLDFPFVRMLNPIFYESYSDQSQAVMHPEPLRLIELVSHREDVSPTRVPASCAHRPPYGVWHAPHHRRHHGPTRDVGAGVEKRV